MNTVKIKIKSVYGNELIYPANDVAERFAKLTGRKTFYHGDLIIIKELGFKIEQVNAYGLEGVKS